MATLRVSRMRADAVIPRYKTSGAAGMDLAACLATPLSIPPGGTARVPTGLRIALPPGYEGQVRPRSGLAARHAVTVLNAPGTIDEDYRGEVQVLLINHGSEAFTIESGDRIALHMLPRVALFEMAILVHYFAMGVPVRGDGGFGSTGR